MTPQNSGDRKLRTATLSECVCVCVFSRGIASFWAAFKENQNNHQSKKKNRLRAPQFILSNAIRMQRCELGLGTGPGNLMSSRLIEWIGPHKQPNFSFTEMVQPHKSDQGAGKTTSTFFLPGIVDLIAFRYFPTDYLIPSFKPGTDFTASRHLPTC